MAAFKLSGSPDVFQHFGGNWEDSVTLDQKYVDGVSLTYGNLRSHIWTFVASVNFAGGVCAVYVIGRNLLMLTYSRVSW